MVLKAESLLNLFLKAETLNGVQAIELRSQLLVSLLQVPSASMEAAIICIRWVQNGEFSTKIDNEKLLHTLSVALGAPAANNSGKYQHQESTAHSRLRALQKHVEQLQVLGEQCLQPLFTANTSGGARRLSLRLLLRVILAMSESREQLQEQRLLQAYEHTRIGPQQSVAAVPNSAIDPGAITMEDLSRSIDTDEADIDLLESLFFVAWKPDVVGTIAAACLSVRHLLSPEQEQELASRMLLAAKAQSKQQTRHLAMELFPLGMQYLQRRYHTKCFSLYSKRMAACDVAFFKYIMLFQWQIAVGVHSTWTVGCYLLYFRRSQSATANDNAALGMLIFSSSIDRARTRG